MHASTIISALAITAVAGKAVPNAGTENNILHQKRVQNIISLWGGTCYGGPRFDGAADVGICTNIKDQNFENKVLSGKAGDGFTCTVFETTDCKGNQISFGSSENGDPKFVMPGWLGGGASSWRCETA